MRRSILCIAILAFLALVRIPAAAATDPYGGITELKIPGAPTGRWSVATLTQADGTRRLVFVTPAGNAFWLRGVYALNTSGSVITLPGYPAGYTHDQRAIEKAGSRGAWLAYTVKRVRSWAFNTVADYSHNLAYPIADDFGNAGSEKVAFTQIQRPAYYSVTAGTIKNIYAATDPAMYPDYRDRQVLDVYDPAWAASMDATKVKPLTDPNLDYFIGLTLGDSDDMFGMGPGPDLPASRLHPHIGGAVLIASPTHAANPLLGKTYTDPKVYSKYAFRDQMKTKYGTIAALNTAWGASYTTFDSDGGWPMGKGFLDESGRNAWIGKDRWAFTGATAGVKADLDGFLLDFMRTYFRQMTTYYRARYPGRLMFSMSTFNAWGGITRAPILKAAGEFCDVIHAAAGTQEVLDRTMALVGDRPLIGWIGNPANADSALFRTPKGPDFGVDTQVERGAWYTTTIRDLLNKKTSSGLYPFAGFKHWEVLDNWGESVNWGLITFYDNAYNGKDAVAARGTDAWGFPSGGEERNYGDYVTPVTRANASVDTFLATGTPTAALTLGPTSEPTPPASVLSPQASTAPTSATAAALPVAVTQSIAPASQPAATAAPSAATSIKPAATATQSTGATTQSAAVAAPAAAAIRPGVVPPAAAVTPQMTAAVPPATVITPSATMRDRATTHSAPAQPPATAATPSAAGRSPSAAGTSTPAARLMGREGATPPPQIVFGSAHSWRHRSLPITVTDDTELATVKVFINNKLHLTLATTSPNLKFSQPLPNRKVVTVKVEATDAVGNRKTQEITIRR